MAHRNFTNSPAWTRDGSRDPANTDSWLDWMSDELIIHDFLPRPEGTCVLCGSPVPAGKLGGYYLRCFNCNQLRPYVDALLPASYSLDSGLESLIRAYKDFGRAWAAAPVATLLWELFGRHGDCIKAFAGPDAIYTWVPADDPSRNFDHIEKLLTIVKKPDTFGWRDDVVVRNREVDRPRPGKGQTLIVPEAYRVVSDVAGRTVVVLDDLWTSGASMGSTACALKQAGATRVIGVVLGRQLNRGYQVGNSEKIFTEIEERGWRFDECTLCT